MDLDYSTPGVVRISMIKYLDGVLGDFSEELGTPTPSPAASHLFQVRDEKDAARLEMPREQRNSIPRLRSCFSCLPERVETFNLRLLS